MTTDIAAPKPDPSRRQSQKKYDFEALSKRNSKGKSPAPKLRKSAALAQPLHYDLRCQAAKDNNITHAAAAPSNLDATITMRLATSRG